MQIRRLDIDDLHVGALDEFERAQETTTIRALVDGRYTEVPLSYVEDWDVDKRRDIVRELRQCINEGGVVVGAVERRALFGFTNVVASRFGSNNQYVEMPYLHVSRELRGQGAGRELFTLAVREAKALGAPLLYIATNPSVATQAFYDAMGCVPADELKQVEPGNDEIHHQFPLTD